ncbi:MAG: GntR family transcriptional regulator [Chloroflexota bacterium]
MRVSEAAASTPSTFRPLREIVQAQLLHDIVRGKLPPGDRLNETRLAHAYGVSRGPVREALRALEGQGLVRFVANKGAVLTRLSRTDVKEIYDIRIELEGLAARHGAARISEKGITRMRRLVDRMDASTDANVRWLTLNNELHMTLYEASGNVRLCALISDQMTTLQPYTAFFLDLPGRLMDTHSDHRLLLNAVAQRDAVRSELVTEEHLRRAAAILVSMITS